MEETNLGAGYNSTPFAKIASVFCPEHMERSRESSSQFYSSQADGYRLLLYHIITEDETPALIDLLSDEIP